MEEILTHAYELGAAFVDFTIENLNDSTRFVPVEIARWIRSKSIVALELKLSGQPLWTSVQLRAVVSLSVLSKI